MTALQAASMLVDLDQKSIPEWYVVVVGHVNADGDQAYKYHIAGDVQYGSIFYALEGIKHTMIMRDSE